MNTRRRHELRELMRDRDLRLLLVAQFLAQAADGLAQAVFADVLVLEPLNAGTPARILTLFAVTLLPYSLLSPFMGVLVDRWPRRHVLVWTNVIRGVMLLSLFAWSRALPGTSGLFAATLLLLGLGRMFLTTKGAVLPVLLHEHRLLRGNAVSGGGGMVATLVGAVAGIGLVTIFPAEGAFAAAGAIYVGAAVTAGSISTSLAHGARDQVAFGAAVVAVGRDLIEGVRAIWRRAHARLPLLSIFLLRTLAMFVAISAILIIKNTFGEGERIGRLSSSALALGAAGVGAFIGALTAPAAGNRLERGGLMLFGFAISSAGIVALGGIVNIYAVMALTFLGGYGGFVTKVAVDAAVQEALPDHYRGRAFALYDILYNAASVVAGALMVAFYDATDPEGLRILLIVAGFVGLFLTAVLATAFRRAGIPLNRGEAQQLQHQALSRQGLGS
ncbi:MAG: MFS transporter [Actinomycetota bacterium]|nr:MFS transporter [Actinomycetota bacterium]